jgi:hypothetical protein
LGDKLLAARKEIVETGRATNSVQSGRHFTLSWRSGWRQTKCCRFDFHIDVEREANCVLAIDRRKGSRRLFARSFACTEILAAKVRDEPEEQRQAETEHNAGHDREVESGVFSTIGNVSRETAEAERKLAAEVEKRTDENDKASEEEEHAADFAERLHKKIVEEKEKRSTYWEPCRLRKELDRGRERMGIALVDDVKRLLDSRNFVHLATVMSDGSPHSAVVWAGREGDRILVCTEEAL